MRKIYIGRVLLVLLSLLGISSCAGGGSSGGNTAGAPIEQKSKLNSGKVFGYYGDCNQTCFSEYSSYVSFYHSAPWSHDFAGLSAGISEAQNMGKRIILSIPDGDAYSPDCASRISNFLTYLDSQNLLKNIWMIYPKDEPNLNGKLSEAEIKRANSCVRDAAGNFEGTRGKPLYAIYSCGDPWVAIEDFDVISCDQYEIGDQVLTSYLPLLKKLGKPVILTAGGACPWNYNPYAMVVAANSDDQIIGIEGFIYLNQYGAGPYCGIKGSVTLPLYQALLYH
jgi:hypothetical protein